MNGGIILISIIMILFFSLIIGAVIYQVVTIPTIPKNTNQIYTIINKTTPPIGETSAYFSRAYGSNCSKPVTNEKCTFTSPIDGVTFGSGTTSNVTIKSDDWYEGALIVVGFLPDNTYSLTSAFLLPDPTTFRTIYISESGKIIVSA